MKLFWKIVYNIFLYPLFFILMYGVGLFNPKVKEGFSGRKYLLKNLRNRFISENSDQLVYWFHCASHGEFELLRPVLKGLKEIEPECFCIVSFFSPSGYTHGEDRHVDLKIYLPLDFYWTCYRVLKIIRPHKLVFIEYDLWPNLVWCAEKMGIKTTIFSARIREKSSKLKPIVRSFYRHIYRGIDIIYTVSEKDCALIQQILGHHHKGQIVRVLGNPRYDRVMELANDVTLERTKSVLDREMRFIAGSVWPEDEEVILNILLEIMGKQKDLFLYWVPHEPLPKFISKTYRIFQEANLPVKLYSECKDGEIRKSRAVIINRVGILSELYWQGRYAYVGGGFTSGIHNVMEPAIARLPTIFGPKFHNSDAAEQLVNSGGGFSISTQRDFRTALLRLMNDKEFFLNSSMAATGVIHRNVGSATRIVRGILRD